MSPGLLIVLGVVILVAIAVGPRLVPWVRGLRVRTARWQADQDHLVDLALRRVISTERDLTRSEEQKRQLQRVIVLLSEPLKDWDLADFPHWAEAPAAPRLERHHISADDARHLHATVQAYRLMATELGDARMAAWANDAPRQRGWDDQPLKDVGLTAEEAAANLKANAQAYGVPASAIRAITTPKKNGRSNLT
jgi:hypothetical protein